MRGLFPSAIVREGGSRRAGRHALSNVGSKWKRTNQAQNLLYLGIPPFNLVSRPFTKRFRGLSADPFFDCQQFCFLAQPINDLAFFDKMSQPRYAILSSGHNGRNRKEHPSEDLHPNHCCRDRSRGSCLRSSGRCDPAQHPQPRQSSSLREQYPHWSARFPVRGFALSRDAPFLVLASRFVLALAQEARLT